MRLIEKVDKRSWSKQVECSGKGNTEDGCGSKLEINHEDLYTTVDSRMSGRQEHYTSFKCCNCGAVTDINESGLPEWVVRSARTRNSAPGQ